MKALKFLLTISIVLFFFSGNAFGQTTNNKVTEPMYFGYECNGASDVIYGDITWHWMMHFDKEGNVEWTKWQAHGNSLVSLSTQEEFNLSYKEETSGATWLTNFTQKTIQYNLVGDQGTHLIYSITWDVDVTTMPWTWTKVSEKIKCF